MPTTVVRTIGTAGDYTTLQSWEDACPANLVAADQIWQGQAKNQEFAGTSTMLTIAGQTTDATRYVELTTEAGASFADNANKLTNALRYNASNGAAVRNSAGYTGPAIVVSTAHTRISKLQVAATGTINTGMSVSGTGSTISQCIVLGHSSGLSNTTTIVATDCLFISTNASRTDSAGIYTLGGNVTAYNCTAAVYSTASPNAFSAAYMNAYGTMLLKNCAGFGYGHFTRISGISGSSSNNGSDKTIASGTSNQASLVYANQFENTASGTADYRLKTGATLIGTGANLSGSGVVVDIVGTSITAPYPIGCWFASAGTIYTDTVAETLTLADTALVTGVLVDSVAEVLSMSDSASVAVVLTETITETLVLEDAVHAAMAYSDNIIETIGLIAAATASTIMYDTITETLNLRDFVVVRSSGSLPTYMPAAHPGPLIGVDLDGLDDVNVDEIMGDDEFMAKFMVRRVKETVNEFGRAEHEYTAFVATGSFQPAMPSTYMQFPELSRVEGDMEVFTQFRLTMPNTVGNQGDLVIFEGQTYMVRAVSSWRGYGNGYQVAVLGLSDLLGPNTKTIGPPPGTAGVG